MKKTINFLLSFLVTLSLCIFPTTASASELDKTSKQQELLNYLENSKAKEFATTPESLEAYNNIKKNAIGVNFSDSFVKIDNVDGSIVKTYTNLDEEKVMLEIESSKSNKITPYSNVSSNSEDRYSWIKLTVEAYDFGGNDYLFAGFYKWLTKPFFMKDDVLTLGHDASISFDTDSAFGYTQCEYYIPGNQNPITSSLSFNFSESKKDTTACTSGVGKKFPLTNVPDMYPAVYQGAIYCNGWINNGYGGNLQVSYGHSQYSMDFSIENAITWLPNGAIKFNITGYQDVATHGTAVRY